MSNVPSTSTNDYWRPEAVPPRASPSQIALRSFCLGAACVLVASSLTWGLISALGRVEQTDFHFPVTFFVTSLLLISGSVMISLARRSVQWERQTEFRAWLRRSVVVGTLFMGVQSYALWTIVPPQKTAEVASLGVAPFALALATLHGLHFLVATWFVAYVTVQAHAGRYDHEYYWGVSVCASFWHALGIAWGVILAVYSIVAW